MRFGEIEGHRGALAHLRSLFAQGRLPHALLFSGPEGVGKRAAALALAQLVQCRRPAGAGAETDACGDCDACRKVSHGNHLDVSLVVPMTRKEADRLRGADPSARPVSEDDADDDDEGPDEASGTADRAGSLRRSLRRRIWLDQVRYNPQRPNPWALEWRLQFRPFEGGRPFGIVDEADRMEEETANALLKALEEPPGGAMIVLVSGRADRLLPTVLSRCRRFDFSPLPQASVAKLLASHLAARNPPVRLDDASLRALAADACGSVGAGLRLASAEFASERERVLSLLSRIASGGLVGPGDAYDALMPGASSRKKASDGDKALFAVRLELLTACLRERMLSAAREGADAEAAAAAAAAVSAAQRLTWALEARNANVRLAFDALALDLADALSSASARPRAQAAAAPSR